jgi:hypothetical protein
MITIITIIYITIIMTTDYIISFNQIQIATMIVIIISIICIINIETCNSNPK